MTRRAGVLRLLAALAVLVAVLPTRAAAAAPGPIAQASATPALALVGQDDVVAPDGTLHVVLALGPGVPDDARLLTAVHARLGSPRADVRAALDGGALGPLLLSRSDPVAALSRAGDRITVSIPTVVERADGRPGENVRLALPGIYPVRFTLRATGQPPADVLTFVVRAPAARSSTPPVPVALVVPVASPPTLQADGSTAVADAVRDRLGELVRILRAVPQAPITAAIAPELLEGLQRTGRAADAALVSDLAQVLASREVVSRPYVRIDPTVAAAGDLATSFVAGLAAGEDALQAELGSRPVRTTWVAEAPLSAGAFTLLRSVGVRTVVVPSSLLADGDGVAPAGTVTIAGEGARVPAVVADDRLAGHLDPGPDPVLAAHQLVAELLATGLDAAAGAIPPGAPVVVALSERWQPSPAGIDALLSALAAPAVRDVAELVPLEDALRTAPAANGPDGSGVVRSMADAPVDASLTDVARSVTDLEAFVAAAGSIRPDRPIDTARLRLVPSTDLTAAQRRALLDEVRRDAESRLAVLEDVPTRTVTLAGDTASIPVTLRARVSYPVIVRLRLESDRLAFPDNDRLITVDGQWQGRVPVRVRANGTAPVTLLLLTPAGDVEIARGQLEVRALGLSGLGVLLSGGAVLVLAAWWLQHHRARRRRDAPGAPDTLRP